MNLYGAIDTIIKDTSGRFIWGADSSAIFYTLMDSEHRPNELRMREVLLPPSSVTANTKTSFFGFGNNNSDTPGAADDNNDSSETDSSSNKNLVDNIANASGKPSRDISIFVENDSLFYLDASKTSSKRFIILSMESKETSEQHVIDLENGSNANSVCGFDEHAIAVSKMKLFAPRVVGVRYDVDHQGDNFLVVTNKDNAKTNKLCKVSIVDVYEYADDNDNTEKRPEWTEVVPYDPKIQIDYISSFQTFVAIFGREGRYPGTFFASIIILTL